MSADILTPNLKDIAVLPDSDSKAAVPDTHEERAVSILQKDANDRSADDIEYLYDWVVGLKTQFFKEFDAAVIKQVCRVMKYERIPANKTVFKQGDPANKLYVVIHGSVSLWVINDNHDMEYPDPKSHTLMQLAKMAQNSVNSPSIQKMQAERTLPVMNRPRGLKIDTSNVAKDVPTKTVAESPEKRRLRVQTNPTSPKKERARHSLIVERKPEEMFVGFIRAGGPKTSFGELGLISNTTRSATIRTDLQDCEFLVIEKDDFDRVLKSLLFDALASKVQKMKKFKLFEQMSDVHLKKIALHLERRVVPPKTLLAKEGNPALYIYFLLKGSAEITKLVTEEKDKQGNLRIRQPSAYEQVSILNDGAMFGAAEALSEAPKAYTHALRSVTECEFWQIERGELMRRARPDLYEDLVAADEKENGTDPA